MTIQSEPQPLIDVEHLPEVAPMAGTIPVVAPRRAWWLDVALIFLVNRLCLWLIAFIAQVALPVQTGAGFYHAAPGNLWLDGWARWDSGFYLEIASGGYRLTFGEPSSVAFFPLYPIFVNLVSRITNNALIAGILVSHAALLGALLVLYKLTLLEFGHSTARRAVYYILIFPTAFFFSAVYTESLYLLLTVGCAYCARRRWWAWAGVLGCLASATRIVGISLVALVALEWLRDNGFRFRTAHRLEAWRNLWSGFSRRGYQLVWLLAIPLGLVSQMVFLGRAFGDPIAFWTTQATFGRTGFNPLVALIRDLEPVFRYSSGRLPWNVPIDLAALVLVLASSVWIGSKLGSSYAVYALIGVFVPLAGGTGSLARYVVVLFPVFMVLAHAGRKPMIDGAIRTIWPIGLGLLTALFVCWVFVG